MVRHFVRHPVFYLTERVYLCRPTSRLACIRVDICLRQLYNTHVQSVLITSLPCVLRDVEPGLMTTELFVTCILVANLFPICSLLFMSVKFLLFCLGSLEKYPKIGFPQCKLNNSIDCSPFCAGNLSFRSQRFFTSFTRVKFYYHFLSYSNPVHTLNIVTYSKQTLIFSSQTSIAKIPTPYPEPFPSTPLLKPRCLETV